MGFIIKYYMVNGYLIEQVEIEACVAQLVQYCIL